MITIITFNIHFFVKKEDNANILKIFKYF